MLEAGVWGQTGAAVKNEGSHDVVSGYGGTRGLFFYVLLTVHLSIILVTDQVGGDNIPVVSFSV